MADELKLNHLTEQGNAHMVDVSEKAETKRIAIAEGFITMQAGTLATVLSHRAKKATLSQLRASLASWQRRRRANSSRSAIRSCSLM